MIFKKQAAPNDVVFIRLVTGEEVVGTLQESPATIVTLSKPRIMHYTQTPSGGIQAGMGPLALTIDADATVSFPTTGLLVLPIAVAENIKNEYIKQTSSIVPASSLIR